MAMLGYRQGVRCAWLKCSVGGTKEGVVFDRGGFETQEDWTLW